MPRAELESESLFDATTRSARPNFLGDKETLTELLGLHLSELFSADYESADAFNADVAKRGKEIALALLGKDKSFSSIRNWNRPGAIDKFAAKWLGSSETKPEAVLRHVFVKLVSDALDVSSYIENEDVTEEQSQWQLGSLLDDYADVLLGVNPSAKMATIQDEEDPVDMTGHGDDWLIEDEAPDGDKGFDELDEKGCGAGAPGHQGFMPGNVCASGGGSTPVGPYDLSKAYDSNTMSWVPGEVGKSIGVSTSNLEKNSAHDQAMMSLINTLEGLIHTKNFLALKPVMVGMQPYLKKKQGSAATEALVVAMTKSQAIMDGAATAPLKGITPTVNDPNVATTTGWKKVGASLGTEKGGTYEFNGEKYYVKTPDDPARARNEMLAFKLYELAGVPAKSAALIEIDGKLSLATKWENAEKVDWKMLVVHKEAAKNFAAHAWLNNWDVIGAGSENPKDNMRHTAKGLMVMDAGGALDYKGMGGAGKKPFTAHPDAWDTLRNPKINPSAASVFGGLAANQLANSASKLAAIKDGDINLLVKAYGNGNSKDKTAMAKALIARRDAIVGYGKALDELNQAKPITVEKAKEVAKASKTTNIAVPAPPHIPLDGVPATVQRKKKAIEKMNEIFEASQSGDISKVAAVAVKDKSALWTDKQTVKYKNEVLVAMAGHAAKQPTAPATAKPLPPKPALPSATTPVAPPTNVAPSKKPEQEPKKADPKINPSLFPDTPTFHDPQYPIKTKWNKAKAVEALAHAKAGDLAGLTSMNLPKSPKFLSWHAELVQNVSLQQNPPPPHTTKLPADLAAAISKIPDKPTAGMQKVGYWNVIGGMGKVPGGIPAGHRVASNADPLWAKGLISAKKNEKDLFVLVDYTGNKFEDWNAELRAGKPSKGKHGSLEAANVVMRRSIDIPVGLQLDRGYSDYGSTSKTWESMKPGDVISDRAILSTSTRSKGNGMAGWTVMKLTVGPGVKGVPAEAFTAVKGEYEVMLPPNQRIVVTKIEEKPGIKSRIIHGMVLPTVETQCCPP